MGKGYKRRKRRGKQQQQQQRQQQQNNNNDDNNNKVQQRQNKASSYYYDPNFIQTTVDVGNFRMECYYALQGLHNYRFDDNNNNNNNELVLCIDKNEIDIERIKWRTALGDVLPVSFRISKDIPNYLKTKMIQEINTMINEISSSTYSKDDNNNNKDNNGVIEEEILTDKANEEYIIKEVKVGENETDESKNQKPNNNNNKQNLDNVDIQLIPFIINNCGYQINNMDRKTIRKHPILKQLKDWLTNHYNSGHITRQETVSMLPPVLLNINSNDTILDMCAAPGSKTSQLLEDLSCNNNNNNNNSNGVLIANDANAQRAYMLVHQLRRILHNHPVALITATPAQWFPSSIIQFDKILCDVPCTGDGTSRKNISIWKNWTSINAMSLHPLQLSIALKGINELLKVTTTNNNDNSNNKLMCYSTCSMNPIENEAIIAQLIRQSNGAIELVEISPGVLNGFKVRPGMTTWKVLCETKSQREIKTINNKNNAKMKAKRKFYQDKRKKEQQETTSNKDGKEIGNDDNVAQNNNDDKEKSNGSVEEENNNEENNIDGEDKEEVNGEEENKVVDSVDTTIDKNNDDDDDDNNKDEKQQQNTSKEKFNPISYDENILLEMAEKHGLHHFKSFDDVPKHLKRRIRQSVFPPTQDEINTFHLQRCIRCLPHDNNTGGFFVALLRKIKPISATDKKAAIIAKTKNNSNVAKDDDIDDETKEPECKRVKIDEQEQDDAALVQKGDNDNDNNEDDVDVDDDDDALKNLDDDNKPVVVLRGQVKGNLVKGKDYGKDDFISLDENILKPMIEFYGLNNNGFDPKLFMARADTDAKIIYYIAKPVKNLFNSGIQERVTIVNTGLKAFNRSTRDGKQCLSDYRVCQEGIHFLLPFMTKRKFVIGFDDFRKCMNVEGSSEPLTSFSEDFQKQVKDISTGSFVVMLKGYENKLDHKLVAAMWKCRGPSVDALVGKIELEGMRRKLDAIEENKSSEEVVTN